MWEIFESADMDRARHRVPRDVLKRYEKWKDIVRFSGLVGLRQIKGFHDEKLFGRLDGLRSSRLGDKWCVIYRVQQKRFEVYVLRITAHDYRMK